MDEARKAVAAPTPMPALSCSTPMASTPIPFRDMSKVRVYAVEPGLDVAQLKIPLWFWNTAEWGAFTQASAKTQRPTLIQALRSVRDGVFAAAVTPSHEMRRYLRTLVSALQVERNSGNAWKGAGPAKGFRDRLIRWKEGLVDSATYSQTESESLAELIQQFTLLLGAGIKAIGLPYSLRKKSVHCSTS
jgi:hypothetical protein